MKTVIFNCNNYSQYNSFLSNKCTLGEHNGLISEHYKFELFQIFDQ